jgi:peptide chain release factor subunit 1
MAVDVTWETLRQLAEFRAERGCAISVFLGLDPTETATAGELQTRVNSTLDEAAKSAPADPERLTHEQREGLKSDFERIRRYLADDLDRDGAHGVAVFSAGLDGTWATLPLAGVVPDAVRVGRQFYLAPLVPLLDGGSPTFVAHVSREQGQVYRLRAGRLEEVAERTDAQHGRHQQGGWSQARYQRNIEQHVQSHLRAVADELDRRVRRFPASRVVIVSTEELRTEFEGALSNEARRAVVGWTNAQADASPAELLEAVKPVLDSVQSREEEDAIERWREEAGRDGRATSGWAATLEAASDSRVDVLLYQEGAKRAAWRCPKDGRLSADPGSCPLDGTPMEEDDAGLDLAIQQTLAHGGRALAIRHHQDLEPVEGIGALLRF